uniref:LCCL domain-containing protein n=1 Tax=Anguilla anguilla TaxID=7936 RepID=A0A0E9X140_ANGAN
MQENPDIARVIGTLTYADTSSICRAAIHAGILESQSGGWLDVMPVDNKRQYIASYQNGIYSESLQNPPGGKAFRILRSFEYRQRTCVINPAIVIGWAIIAVLIVSPFPPGLQ